MKLQLKVVWSRHISWTENHGGEWLQLALSRAFYCQYIRGSINIIQSVRPSVYRSLNTYSSVADRLSVYSSLHSLMLNLIAKTRSITIRCVDQSISWPVSLTYCRFLCQSAWGVATASSVRRSQNGFKHFLFWNHGWHDHRPTIFRPTHWLSHQNQHFYRTPAVVSNWFNGFIVLHRSLE